MGPQVMDLVRRCRNAASYYLFLLHDGSPIHGTVVFIAFFSSRRILISRGPLSSFAIPFTQRWPPMNRQWHPEFLGLNWNLHILYSLGFYIIFAVCSLFYIICFTNAFVRCHSSTHIHTSGCTKLQTLGLTAEATSSTPPAIASTSKAD